MGALGMRVSAQHDRSGLGLSAARLRVAQIPVTQNDFDKWAVWALQEADRIDPLKNGSIAQAIGEDSSARDVRQKRVESVESFGCEACR